MEKLPIQRGLFIPESLYRDLGEVEVVRLKRELIIRSREKSNSLAAAPFDEVYQQDMAFIAEIATMAPPFSRIRLQGADDLGEEPNG